MLEKPFYGDNQNDADNYSGIGEIIAHELTHGFDDQGRLFDKKGVYKKWWTTADIQHFKKACQKIINLFNNQKIINKNVNGELTQGENIADLIGLLIAYQAFNLKKEQIKINVVFYKFRI